MNARKVIPYLLPPTEVAGHLLSVRPGLGDNVGVFKDGHEVCRSTGPLEGSTERELIVYNMSRPNWCTEDMSWGEIVCRLFNGVPQDPLWQEVERLLKATP